MGDVVAPMLAKAVPDVPEPDSVTGGLAYEPKWDGFRAIIAVDGGVESVPAAVVGTSSTGPLCEMPLGAALARAAVLLDAVFTAAERPRDT